MKLIEEPDKRTFTLSELYGFEDKLRQAYPNNKHIRRKIRQQLQVLRDRHYLAFAGSGIYEIASGRV